MADKEEKYDPTRKETFDLINAELNSLYFQLKKTSPSSRTLQEAAEPFLKKPRGLRKKGSLSFSTKLAIYVGLLSLCISYLIYCEPINRFVRSTSRKAFTTLIPIWDWRWMHSIQCFLSNPFKQGSPEASAEDCNHCHNVTVIDRLPNTGELLLEKIASYLNEDIPVIVENATESWPNRGIINAMDLKKLYIDDEVMRLFMCCEFETSVQLTGGDHRNFLRDMAEVGGSNYYAQWQNCFKESAKLFRKVYKRPEFLPSTVELANTNWVFISHWFNQKPKYMQLPLEDDFVMLIQLEGHMDIVLEPVEPCSKICHPLQFRLDQGSALIMTDFLYTAKYIPSRDEESITVGLGGSIDH